jgi:hypothetical protein
MGRCYSASCHLRLERWGIDISMCFETIDARYIYLFRLLLLYSLRTLTVGPPAAIVSRKVFGSGKAKSMGLAILIFIRLGLFWKENRWCMPDKTPRSIPGFTSSDNAERAGAKWTD